jgi:hypothetical protein
MKRKILPFLFLTFIFLSSSNAQDYAASVKVSTLGVNFEVIRSFGENFNARMGAAYFSYSINSGGGIEEYKYTASANLLSASLLADYFPFGQTFRISVGFLYNLNKGDIDLIPAKTTVIGGDEYTPDKLGNLKAEVDFNKIAPYIGIGLGNPTHGESGLGFTFDLGAAYQGAAKINLTAEGLLAPSAAPDQEEKLESNLSWFKWYPVLSFGIVYKF